MEGLFVKKKIFLKISFDCDYETIKWKVYLLKKNFFKD